MYKSTTGAKRQ